MGVAPKKRGKETKKRKCRKTDKLTQSFLKFLVELLSSSRVHIRVVRVFLLTFSRLRGVVHVLTVGEAQIGESLALGAHGGPLVDVTVAILRDASVGLARLLEAFAKSAPALPSSFEARIRLARIRARTLLNVARFQRNSRVLMFDETFHMAFHEPLFAIPTHRLVCLRSDRWAFLPHALVAGHMRWVLVFADSWRILLNELALGFALIGNGDMNEISSRLVLGNICAHGVPVFLTSTISEGVVLSLICLIIALIYFFFNVLHIGSGLVFQHHYIDVASQS